MVYPLDVTVMHIVYAGNRTRICRSNQWHEEIANRGGNLNSAKTQ
jgi:hypothetical protein